MVNRYFVSHAEGAFFRVLREVVGDRAHLLSQVAVNRLIYFPGHERSNFGLRRWRAIINARSVDFVLADRQTLRPLVAIELDDASHKAPDRQDRDGRIDLIFEAAQLPLIRVKAASAYNTRELHKILSAYLR